MAARKRKSPQDFQPAAEVAPSASTPAGSANTAQSAPPEANDLAVAFDPAKLEAQSATPASGEDEPRKAVQPDPFPLEVVSLGREKDAPKMRLYRSNRYKQIAVQFDEKPGVDYTQMLTEAGFRWRANEGVWTRQMDPEARWKSQADAERLFRAIADAIRAERGLEPVQAVGV